jgi:hypothetical protein
MKSFLLGLFVAIAIAVGAHFVIGSYDWSAAAVYSTPNVRL